MPAPPSSKEVLAAGMIAYEAIGLGLNRRMRDPEKRIARFSLLLRAASIKGCVISRHEASGAVTLRSASSMTSVRRLIRSPARGPLRTTVLNASMIHSILWSY